MADVVAPPSNRDPKVSDAAITDEYCRIGHTHCEKTRIHTGFLVWERVRSPLPSQPLPG